MSCSESPKLPSFTVEDGAKLARAIAGFIGKKVGGEPGRALATWLAGDASLAASTGDLLDKFNNGTATWQDIADVALAATAVVAAATALIAVDAAVVAAAASTLTIVGAIGVSIAALSAAWDNRENILDGLEYLAQHLPSGADFGGVPNSSSNHDDCEDDKPKDPIPGIRNKFDNAKNTVSPLILDLNGDGVKTLDLSAEVYFDHDNNQFAELSGWVGKDDGLLVLDKNANGQIDSGAELFGSNTVLVNGSKAANGFSALAELDSNLDGKIDASDTAFNNLRVWKDANSDGITDAGELLSLSAANVKSINLNYSASNLIDPQGNAHQQTSTCTTSSGAVLSIEDVWFSTDLAYTQELNNLSISEEIAALPDIQGFGNIHSLHQAMARDS